MKWPAYDRPLVRRGDAKLWLSRNATAYLNSKSSDERDGLQKYRDLTIETALALGTVFHLRLRQAEGFLGSMFEFVGIQLDVTDHTTLLRCGGHLIDSLQAAPSSGPIDPIVNSFGLVVASKGECAAIKHGEKGLQD